MFRIKYLTFILSCFFFILTSFAQPQLNPKLSTDLNPILSPEALKNMPYAQLFLGMNVVPALVWDNQGGLVAANDAYLQMIGYTRQEMLSGKMDWVTITPPEYRALDQHCIEQLQSQTYCTPYVKEYIRKDGKRIAIKLWNARDMEKGGYNVAIILPLSTDITQFNR